MLALLLVLAFGGSAFAQGIRLDSTVTQAASGANAGFIMIPANPQIAFCNFPANSVPCTNRATTFTSNTLATPCNTSTQIVLTGTTSCVASPDAQGNWGVWAAAGQYAYTITLPGGINLGPYNVTLGIPSGTNLPSVTIGNLNSVVYLDGVTHTTLANCYAAIPSTGGACVVPPNYTETLAASLTMNKADCGFIFMGRADITMGSNQVIVSPGTHGAFLYGQVPFGGGDITTGTRFFYAGSGNAFSVGSSGADTRMLSLKNITVNLVSGASGSAVGLYATRLIYFDIQNFSSVNQSSSTATKGLVLDGTGNFSGTGRIANPYIVGHLTGILGTGSGAAAMNTVTISGGTIQSSVASAIGLDIEAGDANVVTGLDLESNSIGVKLGSAAFNNNILFRSEANTTDVTALASSAFNVVRVQTEGAGTAIVKSDSGTNNHISRAVDGDFATLAVNDTITSTVANGDAVLSAVAASTNAKFEQLGNTGNPGFYYGVESSVGGTVFTGSQANEPVLYSTGGPNSIFTNKPLRWVGVAFASLGTPVNGVFTYCPDCTIANPCAGGGTGAFAKRLNGVWVCN